ncbi:MAG: 16S rRNA (uracil(1498)-N(3))-methyltransferase [Corynebacterium sp.]|nr:16S rRNA (uracil(1498)-N(3))-methyltransferase [Corynebacterium sp.]
MSLPVFYTDPQLVATATSGATLSFEGPEARHALTVTRHGIGDQILLASGQGTLLRTEITTVVGKDACQVLVHEVIEAPRPRPEVTIVQALPKSERSELAVDLAVQAGADAIIPWQADRCIAKWTGKKAEKGREKWETMATQAARQSRRPFIPPVHAVVDTKALCRMLSSRAEELQAEGKKLLITVLHEDARRPFKDYPFESMDEVIMIIGPEGGIGAEELERLENAGATAIRLGPEVLRTATAAAIGLAALGVRTSRWDMIDNN